MLLKVARNYNIQIRDRTHNLSRTMPVTTITINIFPTNKSSGLRKLYQFSTEIFFHPLTPVSLLFRLFLPLSCYHSIRIYAINLGYSMTHDQIPQSATSAGKNVLASLCVHYIYDVAVSALFYNTAHSVLFSPCIHRHY